MIHFDMKLEDFKEMRGFDQSKNQKYINLNRMVVARHKQLYLETQSDNIWPVIITPDETSPLRREYPLIVPSTPTTRHKK